MLRAILARVGLAYLCRCPIQRGKVRLSRLLDPLTRGAPLKSPLGPTMAARLSDGTFWLVMDEYQSFIAETLAGVSEGDIFIDIGANSGMFALVASQRVGPTGCVFAFEPSSREYCELVQNIRLNGAANIVPFRVALGDSDELSQLYLAKEEMSGLNSRSPGDGGDGSTESIVVMRFDSLGVGCLVEPSRRVFVKIDTEGCELQVLRGMQEFIVGHNVVRIVAELNDVLLGRLGGSRQEVYEFMRQLGFSGTVEATSHHYDEVFVRRERP